MENLIIFAEATAGGSEGPVQEIVKTFGVNWTLFISQCIAFLVVALASPWLFILKHLRVCIDMTE